MTFKLVDQGPGDPSDICNSQDKQLYKPVKIDWQVPIELDKAEGISFPDEYLEPGYLYALVRNHGNALVRDRIVYIGITNNLHRRFQNHPKVDEIRKARGSTGLSIGKIDFGSYRTAKGKGEGNKLAIEELEHILIWTLWKDLWNEKKWFTLPGMGTHRGRAWDITNVGHKFSGRMPERIVYPWIVIKPRRNRTVKA
ncbi:MAG: uncharacterized protein JWN66_3530 [Sphingomonas bacterium]|uniref:hypothetical protein n=1 Tax=Sphingomonas bacterium TaxID=1895847 RepID=UPI002609EB50|nr:hypothetical protein [Sphingomonas bacterium]MDB5706414.1 uncharacterized protein [Sphingomonas bacterium]